MLGCWDAGMLEVKGRRRCWDENNAGMLGCWKLKAEEDAGVDQDRIERRVLVREVV